MAPVPLRIVGVNPVNRSAYHSLGLLPLACRVNVTSIADRVPPETETAARSGVATNMKAVTCDRAVGQLPVPLTRVKDVPLKEHHVEVLAL